MGHYRAQLLLFLPIFVFPTKHAIVEKLTRAMTEQVVNIMRLSLTVGLHKISEIYCHRKSTYTIYILLRTP